MAAAMKKVLFSWGSNNHGQLCTGNKKDLLAPNEIKDASIQNVKAEDIRQISGGGSHVAILTNSGLVYTCGQNNRGQLGQMDTNGSDVTVLKPVVDIMGRVVKLACGWEHTLCLTDDGKLFCWGANNYNQLGLPDILSFTYNPQEIKVNGSMKIIDIAAGLRHSLALTEDGKVFVWGSGRRGQLGINNNKEIVTELSSPKQITSISFKIVSVACGSHHSLALTDSGSVYTWGCNRHGALATDNETCPKSSEPLKVLFSNDNRIKFLASGWSHVVAVTGSNELLTWGRNDYGQLGRVGIPYKPTTVANLNVHQISTGSEHNLAINADNSVVSWGWNEHGICGTGNEANVMVPQVINRFEGISVSLIGTGYGTSYAVGQVETL